MVTVNAPTPSPTGKSRIIWVIVAFVVLLVVVGAGIWYLKKKGEEAAFSAAQVKEAPRITSIPGVGTSSEEHIKLIKQENLRKAQEAARTGGSAVPTIVTRPGGGVTTTITETLEEKTTAAPPGGCDPKELERARAAGVKVEELRCKGCDGKEMRAAGYTAGALRQGGFTATELRDSGFTATELKGAGFTASDLKESGVLATDLKNAGFTASELRAGGYTAPNLATAGFNAKDLHEAGYSASDLKSAGFSVAELKNAGYSASDLRTAAFNALDLSKAGFPAAELIAAGFSDQELLQSGEITSSQLKSLRATQGQIGQMPKDCNPVALQQAKAQGIKAEAIQKALNCTPASLKNAGYTAAELKIAGLKGPQLRAAGFTASDLRGAGFNATELKLAGFTTEELKNAGFSAGDLFRAGFTPNELLKAGFSLAELRSAGIVAEELKKAGIPPSQARNAGYTTGELIRAEYTPQEIAAPEYAPPKVIPAATVTPPAVVTPPTVTLAPPSIKAPALAPPPPAPEVKVTPLPPVSTPAPIPTAVTHASGLEADSVPLVAPMPDKEQRIEDMIERIRSKQDRRLSQQQRQDVLKAIEGNMASQAGELFASWSPPPGQQYVRAEKDDTADGSTAAASNRGASAAQPGGPITSGPNGDVIKAGTVMFGVLDTGINSDEQSPILATIVQGQLKGGKLLGQFNRVNKKVVITFNVLSLPQYPNSLTINAVAIDPDTARTAVASSVDNHYMLRYGTLFASSFLAGLGEAVLQSGATTVNAPFGESTTQNPSTSAAEKGLIALGNVGNQYSRVLGQNFQRPPTVKVNSGAGIGVLLMSDLSLPAATSTTTPTFANVNCDTPGMPRCP